MLKEALSSSRSPDRKSVSTSCLLFPWCRTSRASCSVRIKSFLIKIQTPKLHNYKNRFLVVEVRDRERGHHQGSDAYDKTWHELRHMQESPHRNQEHLTLISWLSEGKNQSCVQCSQKRRKDVAELAFRWRPTGLEKKIQTLHGSFANKEKLFVRAV